MVMGEVRIILKKKINEQENAEETENEGVTFTPRFTQKVSISGH